MTVIAATTDGRTVWMGADNAGNCNGLLVTAPKIHPIRFGGAQRALFGCAGDRAAAIAFTHHVKIDAAPDYDDDRDCDRWAQSIAEAWTEVCADNSVPLTEIADSGANQITGVALFAWAGRVWRFTTNLALRLEQSHAAIGAGAEIAYGAFQAVADLRIRSGQQPIEISPFLALEIAVSAACIWSPHCHAPMRYETLHHPGDSPPL